MEFPTKHKKRFFAILYGATCIFFLLYFFFFSENNFNTHRELNRKISNLEEKIASTKNQIGNAYTYDQLCRDSVLLEKYARENLNMHRPDEDVFILVYK